MPLQAVPILTFDKQRLAYRKPSASSTSYAVENMDGMLSVGHFSTVRKTLD
jgi:hypothetical protein